MSIRILLLLFTLSALVSHAQVNLPVISAVTFVPSGDTIALAPGNTQGAAVTVGILGVLVLAAPGTYTASSWDIHGELRLATPGNYTVIASTGSIAFNRTSSIKRGDASSSAPYGLTMRHAGEFSFDISTMDPSIFITQGSPPVLEAPPLVNISTRVRLAAGQTHLAGFVVGGKLQRRVLVRAIGPTLSTFGVANPLATPVVTVVHSNQFVMRTNSGWGGDEMLADTFKLVGAFPLPANSRDAATIATLNPGAYTVQVGGGAGEVLLEIYYVD